MVTSMVHVCSKLGPVLIRGMPKGHGACSSCQQMHVHADNLAKLAKDKINAETKNDIFNKTGRHVGEAYL